ncbi:MAG: helix-turn-helix transcriptional regulator [Oscillospiraceae bacterium]|nr:helix-turn-helix transcriptional regulator [Oscillospiraceae bacterium]
MGISQAVIERINELRAAKELSINRLCTLSAVPQSTISEFMSGKIKSLGIVNLKMLCDGLDISIADFFDTEEFRNMEQEIK